MQKKIIALAVAGLMSGATFAQSNVTVSGKIDAGYLYTTADKANGVADTMSEINEGHDSSFLDFSGEEALGNGMKAIFKLKYNLNSAENVGIGGAAQGNNNGGAREQYVGLSGNMGTVIAGRFYTAFDEVNGAYDSMDYANAFSTISYIGVRTGDQFSNGAQYISPTFGGGFKAKVAYGFSPISEGDGIAYGDNTNTNDDQERAYVAGLSFNKGAFSAMGAYGKVTDFDNVSSDDGTQWAVGASYDFGFMTLMGQYYDISIETNALPDKVESNVYSIGAVIPVGNGRFRVMYAENDVDLKNGTNTKDSADGWAIGYDYDLSKRTMLYAGYNTVSTERDNTLGFGVNGLSVDGSGDASVWGAGIIHKF